MASKKSPGEEEMEKATQKRFWFRAIKLLTVCIAPRNKVWGGALITVLLVKPSVCSFPSGPDSQTQGIPIGCIIIKKQY